MSNYNPYTKRQTMIEPDYEVYRYRSTYMNEVELHHHDFYEIYLLLRDSLSANFLYTSWKRFRKYNAYVTGITQNVQDCLTNDTAYAMLANSEFVVMLRQTKDIDSVVELYGLSEPQRKYLLLAQPGEGIIKMGNSLIPFNNPQPKDTKTYKLLTTKPGEME